MFKKDPLSPLTSYCGRYVITGFGMFTEGTSRASGVY